MLKTFIIIIGDRIVLTDHGRACLPLVAGFTCAYRPAYAAHACTCIYETNGAATSHAQPGELASSSIATCVSSSAWHKISSAVVG